MKQIMTHSFETLSPNGVWLSVKHICGHTGKYWYFSKEFAEPHIENYKNSDCSHCNNEKIIKQIQESFFKKGNKPVL